MKILHVIHSVDPRSGGPGEVIRALVRGQVQAGHEVSLLATSVQSAEPWEAADAYRQAMLGDTAFAGSEMYLAPAWGRRRPWSAYGFSWGARRWLRKRIWIPQSAPDVVHIHGLFSHVTTFAAREVSRLGIPYVLRPAGVLNARCLEMGSRHWKRLFSQFFLRQPLRHAARLHATSEEEAEELRRWVRPERIRVIPHGAELPENLAESAEAFCAAFPQLRGRRIVLFLGRIAAKKRPEALVESLARLRGEFPDLVLVLAGYDDGGMAAVAEAARRHALGEAVVDAGFLQGPLKHGAFAAASVFALPSIDENFGVAALEALAHGTPVLTTPGVAAHTYVDQSGGGLTVDGSVEALAGGLHRILQSDRATMGRQGRAFVQQHLGWPSILQQVEAMYRELCPHAAS